MNPWVSLRKWSSRKLAIKKNKFCPFKTNDTRIFESQEGKQVNMTTSRILDEVEAQMRRSQIVTFRKDITKKVESEEIKYLIIRYKIFRALAQ